MKKCFKGKIKHDFWLGTMSRPLVYNVFCIVLFGIVFCFILLDEYFRNEKGSWVFLISLFAVAFLISVFYGFYFRGILKKWDKKGFEKLCVDTDKRQIILDDEKSFSFAEVESLTFEKCADILPYIPKSYTPINAQLKIKLLNNEEIIYFVQKLDIIYKMHKFFKSCGLPSKAEEFENNIFYKARSNFICFILTIIIFMIMYAYYHQK